MSTVTCRHCLVLITQTQILVDKLFLLIWDLVAGGPNLVSVLSLKRVLKYICISNQPDLKLEAQILEHFSCAWGTKACVHA